VIATLRQRLAGRERRELVLDGYRPSAVAVLLRERDGQTWVPLTVRSAELRAHSGQISLPGGARDPDDESFAATARRESHEELGIEPERIEHLGDADDIPTPSKFVITPVITELAGDDPYTPDPFEVAEVFEAPLSLFSDRDAVEDLGEREFLGISYRLIAFHYEGHRIWGATAGILSKLTDLLR
jgi:8-oxo-dGTP pyrophosphatase MutT (NUDIX family)